MGGAGELTAKRKFAGGPGPDDASARGGPDRPGRGGCGERKLPVGISTAETRKGGEKLAAAKPAVAPEEMMPMVVDESGNEVDPRTGERVKKQEDFEPTPAPVAEAPAPAPATEKLRPPIMMTTTTTMVS